MLMLLLMVLDFSLKKLIKYAKLIIFLWLLLFPIMEDISDYIKSKSGIKKEEHTFGSALFILLFYIYIAYLLYQK
jgi:hypothetical protein